MTVRPLTWYGSFWMVGSLYAALAAWLILGEDSEGQRISPHLNWRHFVGVAALPVFLTLALVVLVIPESPRYMLHKGHVREAAQSLYRCVRQCVAS
jgi:putative MFS transporter